MKLAALAPALFVLVSMCGSPVPPAPGAITGLVFYDANHNAIHDSCDSSLGAVNVRATSSDGTTAEAAANNDGTFRIDVPPGDAIVTIAAGVGFAWPITTAPFTEAGPSVRVESNKETAGVEIGAASRSAFDDSSVSIVGVVFNDKNENGVVDRDECGKRDSDMFSGQYVSVGNKPFVGVGSNGAYELRNVGSADDVVLETKPEIRYAFGMFPDQSMPEDHPCFLHAKPQRRFSANLYEANIPFSSGKKTGTVTGRLFDDANGNGVRDSGEPGIAQQMVYLSTDGPTCGTESDFFSKSPTEGATDEDGFFTLDKVPPGVYIVQLGGPKNYEALPEQTAIMVPGWPQDFKVNVNARQTATVSLPLRVEDGSTISVFVFDDANGDGAWGAGEEAIGGYTVCARRPAPAPVYSQNYFAYDQACGMTDPDGVALLRTLISGQYEIPNSEYYGIELANVPLRTSPATQLVDLAEGEQIDVYLPLDVIPAADQVIGPGAGTPIDFETCFSDPAWIQPPFEAGYASAFPYPDGPPEDQMREIYEQGIYTGNSSDITIWASIAALSDWTSLVPGCSNPGDFNLPLRLFLFVNYEPIAVVSAVKTYQGAPDFSSNDVLQFTLRPRPSGLYAILLPSGDVERLFGNWYLFVDENLTPIERRFGFYNEGGY